MFRNASKWLQILFIVWEFQLSWLYYRKILLQCLTVSVTAVYFIFRLCIRLVLLLCYIHYTLLAKAVFQACWIILPNIEAHDILMRTNSWLCNTSMSFLWHYITDSEAAWLQVTYLLFWRHLKPISYWVHDVMLEEAYHV